MLSVNYKVGSSNDLWSGDRWDRFIYVRYMHFADAIAGVTEGMITQL